MTGTLISILFLLQQTTADTIMIITISDDTICIILILFELCIYMWCEAFACLHLLIVSITLDKFVHYYYHYK